MKMLLLLLLNMDQGPQLYWSEGQIFSGQAFWRISDGYTSLEYLLSVFSVALKVVNAQYLILTILESSLVPDWTVRLAVLSLQTTN